MSQLTLPPIDNSGVHGRVQQRKLSSLPPLLSSINSGKMLHSRCTCRSTCCMTNATSHDLHTLLFVVGRSLILVLSRVRHADFVDYYVVGSSGPQLLLSSLPSLLSTITNLEELHISSHQLLNGTPPAQLSALQQLRVLHLAGPGLQGGTALPAAWGQMQKLQSLWLLNLGGGVVGECKGSRQQATCLAAAAHLLLVTSSPARLAQWEYNKCSWSAAVCMHT
jgi:hypothetical protein